MTASDLIPSARLLGSIDSRLTTANSLAAAADVRDTTMAANLATLANAAVPATTTAVQAVPAAVDAALRATPLPVSGTVTATPTGTQAVSAVSLPLPTGAATEASLAAIVALLTTISADIATIKANAANIKANGAATGLIATVA